MRTGKRDRAHGALVRVAPLLEKALMHRLKLLRLMVSDNLGLRDIVPFTFLRLNQDERCAAFITYWVRRLCAHGSDEQSMDALHEQSAEGEWLYGTADCYADMFETVPDADPYEVSIAMPIALCIIKLRIIAKYETDRRQMDTFQATSAGRQLDDDSAHIIAQSIVGDDGQAERVAEGGKVRAMVNLGYLLLNGAEGVDADAARAVCLYEKAIEEGGEFGAMVNLGNLLVNGAEGVDADAARALSLYERVIENENDGDATYKLAHLLLTGPEGVSVDIRRATELLHSASNFDTTEAAIDDVLLISMMYASGWHGVHRDIELSRSIIRQFMAIEKPPESQTLTVGAIWNMVKKGRDGLEVDVELVAEIEEYARSCSIDLGDDEVEGHGDS